VFLIYTADFSQVNQVKKVVMSVDKKRITELTLRAASGSITPEEQDELDAYLDAAPDNRVRFEERINRQRVTLGLQGWEVAEKTEDESWSRISRKMAGIDQAAGRRVIFLRRAYAIAVTLVLAVAGAWLLWMNRHHPSDQSVPTAFTTHHDILPGGNKATLTLSNGRQIVLDDASAGVLAEQGATKIVKKDSGQLSYTLLNEKPPKRSAPGYNTLTTPKSGTFMVVLPDGSKVWLNSASSLKYPTSFEGQAGREVLLTGEAYFEVAKRSGQPFKVKFGNVVVDVLGTNFDVMAYDDEHVLRTTLLEGAVSVLHGDQRALLKPGEQASIGLAADMKVAKVDVDVAVAWKNGFFNFDHADLTAVMRQLARWYDVTVEYNGKILPQQISGKIQRSLSLSRILKGLENDQRHFTIEDKKIIVTP